MATNNVRYDIRYNGDHYEVVRVRTYYLVPPIPVVMATTETREQAEEEVEYQEALDRDKARDRTGR